MQLKPFVFLFCLATLFSSAGCRSFERDYAAAAKTMEADDPVAGAWRGRWVSDRNGHHGTLKAVLRSDGSNTNEYQARFKATFWKVFSASYEVRLRVVQTNAPEIRLRGSTDLGWLAGGIYEYDATVVGGAFEATYESKADHGRFELERARNTD